MREYDELEVRLTPGREGAYNVEIESAAGARGHGQFRAPAALDVERFRMTVDPRNRQVRGRSRYLTAATRFGQGLFDALVTDASVREVYTNARHAADAAGRGLRVTLSLRAAAELAGIPWEFLYDRPCGFLPRTRGPRWCASSTGRTRRRRCGVEGPLRILGMVSRPKDDALAELDAEEEQTRLEQRLGPAIDSGQVAVRWLERATLPALQQAADHGEDFHVFHYIGHGEYDEDSGESSLVLERPDRRAHRVGGQRLGAVLCGRGSLRLAVLNACETAQTAPQDPLAGVATSLLEYDVPAVVAMSSRSPTTARSPSPMSSTVPSPTANRSTPPSPRPAAPSPPTAMSSGARPSCSCASPTVACSTFSPPPHPKHLTRLRCPAADARRRRALCASRARCRKGESVNGRLSGRASHAPVPETGANAHLSRRASSTPASSSVSLTTTG
jgi:hypothetical protein